MEDIDRLYRKFSAQQCSREEAERLLSYFSTSAGNAEMVRLIEQYLQHSPELPDDPADETAFLKNEHRLMQHVERDRRVIRFPYRWLTVAALLLVGSAIGIYLFRPAHPLADPEYIITDMEPGENRATLTLPDGRTVDLSSEQIGIIVGDGITYADGSEILVDRQQTTDNRLLSLSTPKGGQYQVILPDGTKVWLNAASSLRYPSAFVGPERVVELDGEAYFRVSEKSARPFRVISQGQQVNVLGTEFNVSAYHDQGETITTLVTGAVKVQSTSQAVVLQPGRQSRLTESGRLVSTQVDPSSYVAWKSGIFYFNRTPFEEVMRQLARWYDIEVIYKGSIPQETFSGKMSRSVRLSSVLKLIKGSGAGLRLQNGQLIIE